MKANYRSILSDILGRDLLVSTEPEGSVLGAAAFAYHTLGMFDSFECLLERNPIIRKIRSEVNAHEFYQAQFDRYMHLYWKFQKEFWTLSIDEQIDPLYC